MEKPILESVELSVSAMATQVFPQSSLQEVVERILSSRCITRIDQRFLLSIPTLNHEEETLINQVFDRLRRGLLKVID